MNCKHHYLKGSSDGCLLKEQSTLMRAEINAQLFAVGLNSFDTEDCELYADLSYKKCPFYSTDV